MKYERVELELNIEAMGFTLPTMLGDHPNRVPFRGVLTRLDEPSTRPPNGSRGHLVMIKTAVAEAALASLIGMAVNITSELTDHDAQKKIGVIQNAEIQGRDLWIDGFIYGSDFPKETAKIQAEKDRLGFSYEVKQVLIDDVNAQIWVPRSLVFTGAAILYKDSAAYARTSIAASAEEDSMGMEAITAQLDLIRADVATLLAAKLGATPAVVAVEAAVEPEVEAEATTEVATEVAVDAAFPVEPKDGDKPMGDKPAGDKPAMGKPAGRGKKQFMKICKAMIDAMIDDDDDGEAPPAGGNPEHPDEDQDIALFRKMLHRASAAADKDAERMDAVEKHMEATAALLTDLTQVVKGLITDHNEGAGQLVTDTKAEVSATTEEKPEDAKAERRTLTAADASKFLAKHQIEEREYTIPELDQILKANGVNDPTTRMGIKLELSERRLIK